MFYFTPFRPKMAMTNLDQRLLKVLMKIKDFENIKEDPWKCHLQALGFFVVIIANEQVIKFVFVTSGIL